MSTWSSLLAIGVVGLSVVSTAQRLPAQALTPEDHVEIQQLYAQADWTSDTHADNGFAYASLYTPDGEFRYGRNRAVGRDQLAQLIMKIPFDQLPHHFTLNVQVEATAAGARGRAYALLVPPGQGRERAITSTATYEDVLVKTPAGWRLKERTLHMNALPAPW